MKRNKQNRLLRNKKKRILSIVSGLLKSAPKKEVSMFELFQQTGDSWPPYLTFQSWKIGPVNPTL